MRRFSRILSLPTPEEVKGRKVECPCRKCLQQIHFNCICQHMLEHHGQSTVLTSRNTDTYKARFPINFGRVNGPHNSFDHSWTYDGQRFFARFQQVFPTWYAWVYILGGYKEADDYTCEISAVSRRETQHLKVRITFFGPIHAIDTPKKEVRSKSGYTLQLTEQTVEDYKCEDLNEEELADGYNASMSLEFAVRKKPGSGSSSLPSTLTENS